MDVGGDKRRAEIFIRTRCSMFAVLNIIVYSEGMQLNVSITSDLSVRCGKTRDVVTDG